MYALVSPEQAQNFVALADDDMAESDGREAEPVRPRRATALVDGQRDLDGVIDAPAGTAESDDNDGKKRADCGAGQRPSQPKQEQCALHVHVA